MAEIPIPAAVERFIFSTVDSVAFLDVLFLFSGDASKAWSAEAAAQELRANVNLVSSTMQKLKAAGLIRPVDGRSAFVYAPADEATRQMIEEFASIYRVRPHKVLELIFSPLKKVRDFADALADKNLHRRGRGKKDD